LLAEVIYAQQNKNQNKKKKNKNSTESIVDNFDFMEKPTEKGKFCWSENSIMSNQINNNVQMRNAEEDINKNLFLRKNENGNNPNIKEISNGYINIKANGNIPIQYANKNNLISNQITNNYSTQNIKEMIKTDNSTSTRDFIENKEIFSKTLISDSLVNNNNKPSTPFNSSGSILKNSMNYFYKY
jgi:hypothetical protein